MSDMMAQVQRISRTEKAIRAMDTLDIVEMIHALEDERNALRTAWERSEEAAQNYLQERDAAITTTLRAASCAECSAPPGFHYGLCATGHAIYDNLKATLGGVVPCYGDLSGCHMDDRHDCEGGCLLLKVYRAGQTAAVEQEARREF